MKVSFAVNIQKYTAIYGQASGVPGPPPPQWYGLVGWGGGAGVCGEWSGRLGGVLLCAAREGRDLTQALRKP